MLEAGFSRSTGEREANLAEFEVAFPQSHSNPGPLLLKNGGSRKFTRIPRSRTVRLPATAIAVALAFLYRQALARDINMPGPNGLDVLRDVRGIYPLLPVTIISMQPEEQYATPCLLAGAACYINKNHAPERLALETWKLLGRKQSRTSPTEWT